MNANPVYIDEARVLGMENDLAAFVPVSIAWTQEQLAGNGKCCASRDPVTFLHRNLAADLRGLTLICVHPRQSAANIYLPR
jgi:hypothetical protein